MPMPTCKTASGLTVKNADTGEVEAVFATLNVVDKDGDVTVPGAFTNGAPVVISAYGHKSWDGDLPVGKGRLDVRGDDIVMVGQFFLDTPQGKATFETVKQLGDLAEWSYSLHDVEADYGEHDGQSVQFLRKIHVHEVSPVLRGAGVNTRTLVAKGAGMKLADHLTAVVAEVEVAADRVKDVVTLRAQDGKQIGGDADAAARAIVAAAKTLEEALEAGSGDQHDPVEGLSAEQRVFLDHIRQGVN